VLLRLTPWRRGPLLLLRRPGVALALAAAAFVAVLPAAAAPLFLSSAENATLHRQIQEACPWSVGVRVNSTAGLQPRPPEYPPEFPFLDTTEAFRKRNELVLGAATPGLTGPVIALLVQANVDPIGRELPNPDFRGVNLVGQDTFADHVQVLEGPVGQGLWLPDTLARSQQFTIGDRVRLSARNTIAGETGGVSQPYDVPVVAIFRDLRSLPDQPYWCSLRNEIRGAPGQEFTNVPILPLALVDTDTFLAAGTGMQVRIRHTIEYAVAQPDLTAPRARDVAAGIGRMRATVAGGDPMVLGTFLPYRTTFSTQLERQVRRAELVRTDLLPPVVPITAAGVLVGLAVVAAAAIFWVQRRRQELAVLAAHGVGAGGLGLKAVTEARPAVLLGAAGGWAGAWLLVRGTGPSAVLSSSALPVSTLAAGVTGLAAIALVGAVAAARARALADQAPVTAAPRWWRRLPWELVLLAAAPVAWLSMADSRTADPTEGGVGDVAHVPARLLVVPILVIAGTAVLAGRIAARGLRTRGLVRTPRRPAALLAWRRVARDAVTTAVLAGATAVPIAMATYGASVTDSIRTTTDAEARLVLGSDVVVGLSPEQAVPELPAALRRNTAEVYRANRQDLDGIQVDLLFVDPATFGRGAFWDDRMDGPTLADALSRLTSGSVPAVVGSGDVELGPGTLTIFGTAHEVEFVDNRLLPGVQGGYPLVLVHRDLLGDDAASADRQLWIRGSPAQLRDAVVTAGLPIVRIATIDDLRTGSVHEPVTFTFQYLIALSVFTGLIAVVGLLLYLESRTAAHRRAYVLLRRLGLRAAAHRRALVLELGAPVLVGLLAGLILAGALAYGLNDVFELDPQTPPGTVLVLPVGMAGVIGAAAVVIALGAALLAHRRIRIANPAEVLRDTP